MPETITVMAWNIFKLHSSFLELHTNVAPLLRYFVIFNNKVKTCVIGSTYTYIEVKCVEKSDMKVKYLLIPIEPS